MTFQSPILRRIRRHRLLGWVLVSAGALIVAVAGAYLLYGWLGTLQVRSLAYTPGSSPVAPARTSEMTLEGIRQVAPAGFAPESTPSSLSSQPNAKTQGLYPGERIVFNFWAEPWAAEPPAVTDETLVQGFTPVGRGFLPGERGTLPPATAITIPAIGLEAEVQELKIVDLGDSRQYETPNRVVGHIPETANPGELGNGWLFGHLQSPIRDEGSVFRDLPRIPELLRTGQRVYVILDSPSGSYLYEVNKTDVVYQDDLRLYDTPASTVTLVTCVPPLFYDYRLLVSAKLVGFKPAG